MGSPDSRVANAHRLPSLYLGGRRRDKRRLTWGQTVSEYKLLRLWLRLPPLRSGQIVARRADRAVGCARAWRIIHNPRKTLTSARSPPIVVDVVAPRPRSETGRLGLTLLSP
jgi:hypothetical protein